MRPGDETLAADRGYATGAVGVWMDVVASGSMPLARAVILKVSRVSYFGSQPAVDLSFSVETTHGYRMKSRLPGGASVPGTWSFQRALLKRFMFFSEMFRVFLSTSSAARPQVSRP